MIDLVLPGWAALVAPAYPRWEIVKDATVLPIEGVVDPATAHAWVRKNIKYQSEPIDDWSHPQVTLDRGYGDCEDMAILERALLIAAGWEPEIYIVIARDNIAHVDHALLVTKGVVLDIRTPKLIPLETLSDYLPTYALSSRQTLTFGRRVG